MFVLRFFVLVLAAILFFFQTHYVLLLPDYLGKKTLGNNYICLAVLVMDNKNKKGERTVEREQKRKHWFNCAASASGAVKVMTREEIFPKSTGQSKRMFACTTIQMLLGLFLL